MANSNWITLENQRAGTDTWRLTKPVEFDGKNGLLVAGYLSATSVNPGETFRLYANSVTGACTVEVFRMGWYGGAGGRLVYGPIQLTGTEQPEPRAGQMAPPQRPGWVQRTTTQTYSRATTWLFIM